MLSTPYGIVCVIVAVSSGIVMSCLLSVMSINVLDGMMDYNSCFTPAELSGVLEQSLNLYDVPECRPKSPHFFG